MVQHRKQKRGKKVGGARPRAQLTFVYEDVCAAQVFVIMSMRRKMCFVSCKNSLSYIIVSSLKT
jgi:hypothetical protein